MQLIVTCAGCGAKYRGESSSKKFRCAACSNLFTFPEKTMVPSTGTILCSNCWTETVPTEKLKTCGFCSQRVSPRYGGQALEDKQVKVKQASVRNDPNLVKAATSPASGEMRMNTPVPPAQPGGVTFSSNEWNELNSETKQEPLPDHRKTQAFELLAELKKEIEPEMKGVADSITKAQEASSIVEGATMQPHAPAPNSSSRLMATETASPSAELTVTNHGVNGEFSEELRARLRTLETQLNTERLEKQDIARERDELLQQHAGKDAKLATLEAQVQHSSNPDDQIHELQAKIAELSSLVNADKRSKEHLLRERAEIEELYREGEAKVAELSTRLSSDGAARSAIIKERDELREFRRELEARMADLIARLDTEKSSRETLQRERDQFSDQHRDLHAKVADLTSRLSSNSRESGIRSREEFDVSVQDMEARIADLETRLASERRTKDTLLKERDQLSDDQRELHARVADLETRLHSEREAKESHARRRDELHEAKGELEAKTADLESRLTLERESKDALATERDKLLELRKELEAKTADLSRRHATEKEAREMALKEHGLLQNDHRELTARTADIKARLKAEQDIKDAVRKERDEAMSRVEAAEVRAEKADLEIGRLRKGVASQLEKLGAEYNVILGRLATKIGELSGHAKVTRKRLEEEALFQGDKIENAALDLKARLDAESIEVGQRMKKLVTDGEFAVRESGRHAAMGSGKLPSPTASGSHQVADAPAQSGGNRISGRVGTIVTPKQSAGVNDGHVADKMMDESPTPAPDPEPAPVEAVASSSSSRQSVIAESGGEQKDDKNSGTFWLKVFKRPSAKT